jgi:hypothetical protein
MQTNIHTPIYPDEYEQVSSSYHLTIKDILDIPIGETVCIFFMDRNMYDISCDENINKINTDRKSVV